MAVNIWLYIGVKVRSQRVQHSVGGLQIWAARVLRTQLIRHWLLHVLLSNTVCCVGINCSKFEIGVFCHCFSGTAYVFVVTMSLWSATSFWGRVIATERPRSINNKVCRPIFWSCPPTFCLLSTINQFTCLLLGLSFDVFYLVSFIPQLFWPFVTLIYVYGSTYSTLTLVSSSISHYLPCSVLGRTEPVRYSSMATGTGGSKNVIVCHVAIS